MNPYRRDLVVIGASAGGIEALGRLLTQLPASFPAAVCIVQHQMQGERGHLVDILQRASALPVFWATDRRELRPGEVHVAPPSLHLMIAAEEGRLETRVIPGSRENFSRPSIDRLFRTAASHAGNRVIGLLLTGLLYDGVAGLHDVQRAGGIVMAQDPEEAAYPDLPRNATRALVLDQVLCLDAMGASLVSYAGAPVGVPDIPHDLQVQRALDLGGPAPPELLYALGPQAPIACPECRGPLWLVQGALHSYRCYLGHVATVESIVARQSDEVEQSLWAAVRAMQERSFTFDRLAREMRDRGAVLVSQDYAQRAIEAREHAERIRILVLSLQTIASQAEEPPLLEQLNRS